MTVKRMAVTFLVLLLAGASTASEEGTLGGNCTMGEASDSSLLQQERMLQEPSMGQQMEGPTHATIPGGPIAREGVDDHIAAPWDAEFQVTLELYTVIGKGSCWDSARGHAGGYTAMTSGGNDPVKCLIDCHNTYGDNCAGFDTRDNCLVYTLAGDPANAIVTSKNCDINNNLPDCDHWAGGTCYSAQPPAIHTKKTGPGDAGFQSTVDVSYTLIGKGSCWDSARGYAGGYTAMTSGGNDPVKCLIDCIRTYKENCAGFDTRDNCLVYTLAGDPANAIVMSRNCGINENLPDCDNWAGGTCYSVSLPHVKVE